MGCDIHLVCQKFDKSIGNWKTICTDDDHEDLGNRCYDLFAVLANVRNGYVLD